MRGTGRTLGLLLPMTWFATSGADAQDASEFAPFDASDYRAVNGIAFAPDDSTMYVALLHRRVLAGRGEPVEGAPEIALYSARRAATGWQEPTLLDFSGDFDDYEPALTPDGRLLVFNSKRPDADGRDPALNDLWLAEREGDGWGPPRRIEAVSTFEHEESYGTLTADRTLIYLRGRPEADGSIQYDLFQTRQVDGRFITPTRHPVSTDRWGEGDPWVAPDGAYLIFTRFDESVGWSETVDLYIAFDDGNGWSAPTPLRRLNTEQPEFAPAVSPDGRWLYYRSGSRFLRTELAPLLEEHRPR